MNVLVKSATALTLLVATSGCDLERERMIAVTETERELCISWRDSLPTRSRSDTQQTRDEIGLAYDVHIAACPAYSRFAD